MRATQRHLPGAPAPNPTRPGGLHGRAVAHGRHAARLDKPPRLGRVHALLSDGCERSTPASAIGTRVCAVNSCIAELRANGAGITCRQVTSPAEQAGLLCRTYGGHRIEVPLARRALVLWPYRRGWSALAITVRLCMSHAVVRRYIREGP